MVHVGSSKDFSEAFKNFRQVFIAYSFASVFYMNDKKVLMYLVGDFYLNFTLLSEFQCVTDKVDEHLFEAALITDQLRYYHLNRVKKVLIALRRC